MSWRGNQSLVKLVTGGSSAKFYAKNLWHFYFGNLTENTAWIFWSTFFLFKSIFVIVLYNMLKTYFIWEYTNKQKTWNWGKMIKTKPEPFLCVWSCTQTWRCEPIEHKLQFGSKKWSQNMVRPLANFLRFYLWMIEIIDIQTSIWDQ